MGLIGGVHTEVFFVVFLWPLFRRRQIFFHGGS